MEHEVLLRVEQVGKSYFGNRVLKNVSFSLERGHILGLVGENGAGKSTLMNILFGMNVIAETGGYEGKFFIGGKEAKFRDLTYTDSNGDSQTVRVLAVSDNEEPSSVSDEDVEDPYDPDEPWDPSDPWNPDEPLDPENPDTPDDNEGGGDGGCNGWSGEIGGAGGDPGLNNDGDDCNILNGW